MLSQSAHLTKIIAKIWCTWIVDFGCVSQLCAPKKTPQRVNLEWERIDLGSWFWKFLFVIVCFGCQLDTTQSHLQRGNLLWGITYLGLWPFLWSSFLIESWWRTEATPEDTGPGLYNRETEQGRASRLSAAFFHSLGFSFCLQVWTEHETLLSPPVDCDL